MSHILSVLRVEWQRLWRNKLRRVGLATALLIPVLYSFLYLWAFWNPYGALNQLPVALVNEDTGGTQDHHVVNYGSDLARSLIDANDLGWHTMSNQQAMDGLNSGRYYMVLRIPTSFTQDLLSVTTNHPHRASLDFIPNQGKNYLAGQIVKRVQDEIAANVAQEFSQQYIQRLLDVVGQSGSGLSSIVATANQLAQGSDQVRQGAVQLDGGIQQFHSGFQSLQSGIHQLVPGSAQLVTGLHQTQSGTNAAQQGVDQANEGIASIRQQLSPFVGPTGQLASGMSSASQSAGQLNASGQQIQTGMEQAVSAANNVQSGIHSSLDAVQPMQNDINQALASLQAYQASTGSAADSRVVEAIGTLQQLLPGFNGLSDGLSQSQQGASALTESLGRLQSSQSQVVTGLNTLQSQLGQASQSTQSLTGQFGELDSGLQSVQSGLTQASAGLKRLSGIQGQLEIGANDLHTGLLQAQTGANQFSGGLTSVVNGSQQLVQGSTQLANGQQTFADKVSQAHAATQWKDPTGMAHFMSNPVQANTLPLHPVDLYGQGLTPYFIPLSLWVGSLMLYFLVPMREGRWAMLPVSGWRVVLGKFGVLWGIGFLQAVVASTALVAGLHLSVTSVCAFYLFNIVCSLTYITIIGMLIGLLGTGPGRVIAIVLLVLQLTSSAGTFPLELLPGFFQAVHSVVPMSYAVTGLRDIVATGDSTELWRMAGVTAGYFCAALLVLFAAQRRRVHPKHLRIPDQLVP